MKASRRFVSSDIVAVVFLCGEETREETIGVRAEDDGQSHDLVNVDSEVVVFKSERYWNIC